MLFRSITGGGIEGNVNRIIPDDLCAEIDLSKLRTLPIFQYIKENGNIADNEMLRTFNCGVGLILVVSDDVAADIIRHVSPIMIAMKSVKSHATTIGESIFMKI